MHLTPREHEKLVVVVAADLARRRQSRGPLLNHPESVAILAYELTEGARNGRTVAELMSYGTMILTREQVMEGVADMIPDVQTPGTNARQDMVVRLGPGAVLEYVPDQLIAYRGAS